MLSQSLGIVYRAIATFLVRRAGLRSGTGARTGAVTPIQRFGSALNLNIHRPMLFVDGVYTFEQERPRFQGGSDPIQPELQRLLRAIATRVTRALERQGLLIRDEETASPPSCHARAPISPETTAGAPRTSSTAAVSSPPLPIEPPARLLRLVPRP